MPDYTNDYEQIRARKQMANDAQNNELFNALLKQDHDASMQRGAQNNAMTMQKVSQAHADQQQQVQGQQAQDLAKYKDTLGSEGTQRNVETLSKLIGQHPGSGGSIGENGNVSLKPEAPQQMAEFRQDKLAQDKAENLSKRYQASSGFMSALQDLEAKTNKDGKGGVVSNGDVKLMSAGKLMSGTPSQALGIGELLGAIPKGTTDERKAIERLQLEYQKSIGGLRQTDQMRAAERAATGMMASGDPQLMAKGVRALATNVRNALKITQAGYEPGVRDRVHSTMGDPLENLSTVYDDNAPTQVATPQAAPANMTPRQMLEHLRQKQGK